jgi:hypothetical protein
MKTKENKPFLNMDERNKQVAYRIMAIMYLLTIFAMQAVVIYRQFVLGQELGDFKDIAIIMIFFIVFSILGKRKIEKELE